MAPSTESPRLTLYHYWRSSSSWRVRFALAAKGLEPEYIAINLLSDEAESPEHLARNPMGYVPVLEVKENGEVHHLAESTAIIEWLEENFPSPALLPKDTFLRAHARALAEVINAGIQPLQNLTVTEYLTSDPQLRKSWSQHWIRRGLNAYETLAARHAGRYTIGDTLSLPDIFLVPQCYAALRNEIPLDGFPVIARIHAALLELPAAQASHPDRFKP